MSDTPKTDFVAHESGDPEWNRFPNRFARMMAHAQILERENARLKKAMDKYSEDEMLSVPLHYELMGVIEDVEHGNGFDTNCLQTLKRVMAQLQEQRVYPKEAIRALKEEK